MSRFYSIQQLADQATFLVKDYQQLSRMRFNKLLTEFVLPDLNINVIKDVKRQFLYVNKRLNSIEIPCDCLRINSVSWVDHCGRPYPLFLNQQLQEDIVDIGAKKDCACTCGGDLCNMITGYESVITTVDAEMPDGSTVTFTCTNRKWYDPSGTYYEQTQAPERVYESGEWVNTEVVTTDTELCQLEVSATGCITDCEANYRAVASCGCSWYGNKDCRTTIPASTSLAKVKQECAIECGSWFSQPAVFNGSYNINDAGDRIIFPPNFPFDRVLVRYYYNPSPKEVKIAKIAAFAAISGIMAYDTMFDDNKVKLSFVRGQQFTNAQFALMLELNKYTIDNLYRITAPKIYIP